jgi:hypothetical protein
MKLVEEWRAHRSVKDKPVFTVMKNGYAYHNAFLKRSFEYIDVWYKFTDIGIRFSYYEKRGYSYLQNLISFPFEYVSKKHKNVYILEEIGNMNYKFILDNKIAKIKVFKV